MIARFYVTCVDRNEWVVQMHLVITKRVVGDQVPTYAVSDGEEFMLLDACDLYRHPEPPDFTLKLVDVRYERTMRYWKKTEYAMTGDAIAVHEIKVAEPAEPRA